MKKTAMIMGFCLLAGSGGAYAAEVKVGVVDIQEVVDSIDDGKKAKAEFEKVLLDRKKDLETKEKDFKKQAEGLEKQKLVLSAPAFEEKRRDLEEKRNALLQEQMNAQMDMQKKELDLKGKLFSKVRAVVEKVGKDGQYTLVLEKAEGGVFYFASPLDLTKKVIEEYNKAYLKK